MKAHFSSAMETCLRAIPRGKVATCGAIAKALGDVVAARAVAVWVLAHPDTEGAHRVVRADGQPILAQVDTRPRKEGIRMHGSRVDESHFVSDLPDVGLLRRLRSEQERLSRRVVEEGGPAHADLIGGVDASYVGDEAIAAAVVCNAGNLEPIEIAIVRTPIDFPYIPTYLAYREMPAIERAVKRLESRPDVLIIDGHGRLHPALFGIACLAGLRLGIPTIGVAKHPLAGRPAPLRNRRNGAVPLEIDGIVRGVAWLPPGRSNPLYVSVGHGLSLEVAMGIVRKSTRGSHPEPLRLADAETKKRKRVKNRKGVQEAGPRASGPRTDD